jgi:hypothetical protein
LHQNYLILIINQIKNRIMKKLSLLLVVVATSLITASCGKYDEGPSISLRTKTARITGDWKQVAINDSTITDDAISTINKDGTYSITDGTFSLDGTWAFTDDKTGVIYSFEVTIGTTTSILSDTSTIIRLTNSELWTRDPDDVDKDILKSEKQ